MVVYDWNHYFGLGPIPKPKPKLADTFSCYRNGYRNHISKRESSYQYYLWGIFSIIKGPLKPNLLPNIKYFKFVFEDLGSFSRLQILQFHKELEKIIEELEKHLKRKSFGFGNFFLAPIPKLNLHCEKWFSKISKAK